jgi:hypothetical protein
MLTVMWGMLAGVAGKDLSLACGDTLAFSWSGMAKHNVFQDASGGLWACG